MTLLLRLAARSGATVVGRTYFTSGRPADTLRPTCAAARTFDGRSHSTAAPARLHFCVVGAGPAGFYTADKLLKRYGEHVCVDILDQLPTPFGLVRSGVAPDHPETKNVEHQFTNIARDPRSTFVGNVRVGQDIQLPELQSMYSGVVLAYGAESDRKLDIPGEGALGVLSARKFVWWYNGHPHGGDLDLDPAAVRSVAVLGLGNVALDCARLLLSAPERLAPTDMAERALVQLRRSALQHVHLVARRSPTEAACTPKELREILGLAGPNVHFNTEVQPAGQAVKGAGTTDRIRRRLQDIFSKAAAAAAAADPQPGARQLHFDFLRQPTEVILGDDGSAQAVRVEKTQLQQAEDGRVSVRGSGQFETIPADLVLISIGYRSVPIAGAGFDPGRGIILNRGGRVLDAAGEALPGVYACGWLMRGPSGIIGTNSANAELVADVIGEDTQQLRLIRGDEGGTAALMAALASRGARPTSFADWGRIDAAEVEQGSRAGKPREKIVTMPELLHTAGVV